MGHRYGSQRQSVKTGTHFREEHPSSPGENKTKQKIQNRKERTPSFFRTNQVTLALFIICFSSEEGERDDSIMKP